jgi:mono/diheme cytochrome c family protein
VREQAVGKIFNTITNGVRTMPAYAAQIAPEDRWAIVLYVLALQRSQNAALDDLPPEERETLQLRELK